MASDKNNFIDLKDNSKGHTLIIIDAIYENKISPLFIINALMIFNNLKNPVAHCWSEPTHFKRKFCNACRKRLEDNLSVRCESKLFEP